MPHLTRRHFALGSTALVAGLFAAGWPATVRAQEVKASQADQTAIAVTIYNENLALVKDRRRVRLEAGQVDLAFVDVSAQMRPETALLKSTTGTVTVIEQNFEFDLLTPEKLLEESVGETVRVVRTHPETGVDTVEAAKLLSVVGGIVLKIGDRIETAYPGRIVFDKVPARLRARPTLVLQVQNDSATEQEIEISYLTGGLGWKADYVAELDAEETKMDLSGWVTLTNTSGSSYEKATLQLVAGDVNQVQPAMEKQMEMMATDGMVRAAPAMVEESLFEYHLYTLGRPTTIGENQTKQVSLLTGAGVPVKKDYRFVNISQAYNYPAGELARVNASVRLSFDNKESDHLGVPLPKGIVRVYKNDASGQAIFVGEDAIDHTPKGETVHLTIGQAFDVTAQPKQTEFEQLSDRVFESTFEIELKNAKKEAVTVTVAEQFPAEWKILDESHPHEKTTAFQAEWNVPIPAEGKTVLTYKVRITF
ncbi:MAG: DUF4139 domain-containing protein [Dongiaceae bacterium]